MHLKPFNRRRARQAFVPARDPFTAFRTELDDVFGRFFENGDGLNTLVDYTPSMDVKESEKQITLKIDLPGMEEEDIHLEIEDDLLSVRGERSEESEEENEDRRVVERSYGRFERAMRLPFEPDDKDINTAFKNGVLTVKIKKPSKEKQSVKRIPIGRAL